MGSPFPQDRAGSASTPSTAAPEVLARAVLRCRELAAYLESSLPALPPREDAPFLYGQLDDVLQRLHSSLRQLGREDVPAEDKGGGFLRRLAGRRPREMPRRTEPRYDLQGNAWTIPVTELVGFLSQSGKSGLLWVTSPQETFVLEFTRGHLVHATSNAPPAAFRLGEILLSTKLLEPAELAQVIDHAKAADDLLGNYLLRTGRLKHTDLQRALAIQVQELFHRLMDAENALYRFQEGANLVRSHSLEVNITQLLLESARKKDEERLRAEGRLPHAPEERPEGLDVLAETHSNPPAPLPRAEALATPPAAAAEANAPQPEASGARSEEA